MKFMLPGVCAFVWLTVAGRGSSEQLSEEAYFAEYCRLLGEWQEELDSKGDNGQAVLETLPVATPRFNQQLEDLEPPDLFAPYHEFWLGVYDRVLAQQPIHVPVDSVDESHAAYFGTPIAEEGIPAISVEAGRRLQTLAVDDPYCSPSMFIFAGRMAD